MKKLEMLKIVVVVVGYILTLPTHRVMVNGTSSTTSRKPTTTSNGTGRNVITSTSKNFSTFRMDTAQTTLKITFKPNVVSTAAKVLTSNDSTTWTSFVLTASSPTNTTTTSWTRHLILAVAIPCAVAFIILVVVIIVVVAVVVRKRNLRTVSRFARRRPVSLNNRMEPAGESQLPSIHQLDSADFNETPPSSVQDEYLNHIEFNRNNASVYTIPSSETIYANQNQISQKPALAAASPSSGTAAECSDGCLHEEVYANFIGPTPERKRPNLRPESGDSSSYIGPEDIEMICRSRPHVPSIYAPDSREVLKPPPRKR